MEYYLIILLGLLIEIIANLRIFYKNYEIKMHWIVSLISNVSTNLSTVLSLILEHFSIDKEHKYEYFYHNVYFTLGKIIQLNYI